MKLANKIALITGAGSGMGRVAAVLFAQEGARIGAIDVDKKGAQGTSKMIEAAGGKAIAVKADVSNSADVQMMVATTSRSSALPTFCITMPASRAKPNELRIWQMKTSIAESRSICVASDSE
jgi:NAD(P)-dependent dehydrogenase (short-subunit alcohol dehydrogenase family)